jgi:hypothetical protein
LGVTCKVVTIDYSVSGECGGGSISGVKVGGGEEKKEKEVRKKEEQGRKNKLRERKESGASKSKTKLNRVEEGNR